MKIEASEVTTSRLVQAVFFDLDGTLVDTELLWAEAMVRYLATHNICSDKHEILAMVYGYAWSGIYHKITECFPETAAISIDKMAVALRAHYLELRGDTDIEIPGSVACLRRLAACYPVAIVSGSPRIEIAEAINMLQIESEVSFYLGSEDYLNGKPDPECYIMAARRLGAELAHCVVIEDSHAGVSAAVNAGMKCVLLATGSESWQRESGADLVLSTLSGVTCKDIEKLVSNEWSS